jgi:hypothetical protein
MADRRLPHPPPTAGTPGLVELTPATWYRVHPYDPATARFEAHTFNDSGEGNARFSPLIVDGRVVPTLYAASSLAGALMETVLHDVPYPSHGHHHDLQRDLDGALHASSLRLRKPLRLVDLTKVGLQRMGIRPSAMFETDAVDHARTRAWAQWLYRNVPRAQGLAWLSARYPESTAILLFGDRVPAAAVRPTAPPVTRALRDDEVLSQILWLLDRLGCGVAPDR